MSVKPGRHEGTQPLLGALALEGVFMGVDPVAQRLVPVEGLMMRVASEWRLLGLPRAR